MYLRLSTASECFSCWRDGSPACSSHVNLFSEVFACGYLAQLHLDVHCSKGENVFTIVRVCSGSATVAPGVRSRPREFMSVNLSLFAGNTLKVHNSIMRCSRPPFCEDKISSYFYFFKIVLTEIKIPRNHILVSPGSFKGGFACLHEKVLSIPGLVQIGMAREYSLDGNRVRIWWVCGLWWRRCW